MGETKILRDEIASWADGMLPLRMSHGGGGYNPSEAMQAAMKKYGTENAMDTLVASAKAEALAERGEGD